MFASKNNMIDSALDGIGMGIGFTLALGAMGAVREILGSGAIFGIALWNANAFSIGFFGSSAGAFLTYGLFIAIFNYVVNNVQKKLANKEAK